MFTINPGLKYSALIFFFFILSLILRPYQAFSQKTKQQLEREKKENLKRIAEANKILDETKHKKTATIGKLTVIKQKMETTTKIIKNVSEEISLLDEEIVETTSIIEALEEDIGKMKAEYASMAYSAQKTGNAIDKLGFLFSAESFNQLMMRMKYFEQYNQMRKRQIKAISHVNKILQKERSQLNAKRFKKGDLLQFNVKENESLTVMKDEHDHIVHELTKKEKEIAQELREKKEAVQRLDRLIADIVRKEIERAAALAKARAKAEADRRKANAKTAKEREQIDEEIKKEGIFETPEAKQINSSFQANKSSLIWPVKHGFISQGFGRRSHPVLRGVVVENLGVDIQTNKNEDVRAVFEGKISAVANVPGMGMVVMIQHGNYFTVYARVKNVTVSTGHKVKAKDILGQVSGDKDDLYQLQFQIWKSNEKMDPEEWLLKK